MSEPNPEDIIDVCTCGHAGRHHSATHGMCLQSLDIDEECSCQMFDHCYTIVHYIDRRWHEEQARLDALPVDIDRALADAVNAFEGA